jgi:hypothetical protein
VRGLADLISDPAGAEFLGQNGIHLDAGEFAGALEPPRDRGLVEMLGLDPNENLVYVGQQVCADMARSTIAKFAVARDLIRDHGVPVAILWHDLDSTQSERYGARIVLPSGKRRRGVWLAPRALEDAEPRFIPVERERLEDLAATLRTWVHNACRDDPDSSDRRVTRLAQALQSPDIHTLAEANRAISTLLLHDRLGLDAPATFASEMLARGLLVESVAAYVDRIDEVVSVFNGTVRRLLAQDIDPQVRILQADYLPLWFACPKDGTRLRLSRRRSGSAVFAAATCRCKTDYCFSLGRGHIDLSELLATGRWGIDVSMPVHHNELASGWVAGRSSALYALVFNTVIKDVFSQTPIPVLVPRAFGAAAVDGDDSESLLLHYLRGTPVDPEMALR